MIKKRPISKKFRKLVAEFCMKEHVDVLKELAKR